MIITLYTIAFEFCYQALFCNYFNIQETQKVSFEERKQAYRDYAIAMVERWMIIPVFFTVFLWLFVLSAKLLFPSVKESTDFQILTAGLGIVVGGLANYWVSSQVQKELSLERLSELEDEVKAYSTTKRNTRIALMVIMALFFWVCFLASVVLTSMYISGYFDR